jgi:hypothetical protein
MALVTPDGADVEAEFLLNLSKIMPSEQHAIQDDQRQNTEQQDYKEIPGVPHSCLRSWTRPTQMLADARSPNPDHSQIRTLSNSA